VSSARDDILKRIRAARAGQPTAEQPGWQYGRLGAVDDVVAQFVSRASDYRAVVVRAPAADVPAAIAAAVESAGPVLADAMVRETWTRGSTREWVDDTMLSPDRLDRIDGVLTTATVAIANTGTIILDHGPGQGRRAVTLVPDLHVCVVRSDQIVGDVPEAVARLIELRAHTRPLTWISGPSATSDIELSRVEGVHGPRRLHIIVAE